MKEREVTIKKMPSKEVLEAFLAGFHGNPTVIFNIIDGCFEQTNRQDPNQGKPKTQEGEDWKKL